MWYDAMSNADIKEINMKIESRKILHTDILIIGGGTAGCYAALTIREKSDYSVIIAEKANIKRSGCLAAGVNAINAYIVKGRKPEDYVDYAKKDADGIVREDLLMTMSEGLNRVTAKMESLGLVILKDENGEYVARGNRNIKINGENMKPLLAAAVEKLKDVTVINRINITDYIVEDNTIKGAYGFSIDDGTAYEIRAKKYSVRQAVRPVCTDRTIRDFQGIKCGIRHLTRVQDMQWGSKAALR